MEHPDAENQSFNLSTETSTTVLELAQAIWRKVRPDRPFRYVSDPPLRYDVQKRIPDVSKARQVLGFRAETSLDEMLDEVIAWMTVHMQKGVV
jgi:nucleoside-diphosphate-sugar epimerase